MLLVRSWILLSVSLLLICPNQACNFERYLCCRRPLETPLSDRPLLPLRATPASHQVPLLSAQDPVTTGHTKGRSASAPAIIVQHVGQTHSARAATTIAVPAVTASALAAMLAHSDPLVAAAPASPPVSTATMQRLYDPLATLGVTPPQTTAIGPVSGTEFSTELTDLALSPDALPAPITTKTGATYRAVTTAEVGHRYLSRDAGLTGYLWQRERNAHLMLSETEYRIMVNPVHSAVPPESHPATVLHALYQERQNTGPTPS